MSDKQFISNLSSTYADVRKLDVKKFNLKGKNILEYIDDAKINSDTRNTQLKNDELDIWNTEISLSDNGHIEVKPFEHTYEEMTDEQKELLLNNAAQVINNEVLDTDGNHLMYWQTDGLTDGTGMFQYCTNLTTFSSDLSSLTNGYEMFVGCFQLTSFSSDLPSLTDGDFMFMYCENLESFSSDFPSLTSGNYMFYNCSHLTSFSSDLSSLTSGSNMFENCSNLTTFTSDLPSLTSGQYMFSQCSQLTSFSSDLPNLRRGDGMFNNCSQFTSFDIDLSSLTEGFAMFGDCTNLTSFSSDLSSLTDGNKMFNGCKLDAQSVANIIHFLLQRDAKPTNTYDGNITIGIGITNTDEAKQAFAEECDCNSWEELNKEFDDKNWVVQWQFNGEASTFDLRSPRPSTAVYAKLEEVIMPTEKKAHKPHYQYTSQDGSKFYNIHWYHDSNTNNEGYDYFESLEEAISAYSVIPKA